MLTDFSAECMQSIIENMLGWDGDWQPNIEESQLPRVIQVLQQCQSESDVAYILGAAYRMEQIALDAGYLWNGKGYPLSATQIPYQGSNYPAIRFLEPWAGFCVFGEANGFGPSAMAFVPNLLLAEKRWPLGIFFGNDKKSPTWSLEYVVEIYANTEEGGRGWVTLPGENSPWFELHLIQKYSGPSVWFRDHVIRNEYELYMTQVLSDPGKNDYLLETDESDSLSFTRNPDELIVDAFRVKGLSFDEFQVYVQAILHKIMGADPPLIPCITVWKSFEPTGEELTLLKAELPEGFTVESFEVADEKRVVLRSMETSRLRLLRKLLENVLDSLEYERDGDQLRHIPQNIEDIPWHNSIGQILLNYFQAELLQLLPQGRSHLSTQLKLPDNFMGYAENITFPF